MAEPDLDNLYRQQQQLAAQIALLTKPQLESARDALTTDEIKAIIPTLQTVHGALPPGMAKTQIGAVITVLTTAPEVLSHEISNLDGVIAANQINEPAAEPEPEEQGPAT